MTVTLRQHKTYVSNTVDRTSWSATFDSAPLSGSLLVATTGFQGQLDTQKGIAVSGFTLVAVPPAGSMGLAGAAKFAGSSESSTVTVNLLDEATSGSVSLIISEFEGDFDAASVSDATATMLATSAGTAFTSLQTTALNVTGERLVVPLWGSNGLPASPTVDLAHTVIAHARPGTATWNRAVAAAHNTITDDATHAPEWSWTNGVNAATVGLMAFPTSAEASSPPTGFAAVQSSAVKLSWDDTGGPYTVRRGVTVLASAFAGTTYFDNDVTEGTSYNYTVEGANEVESSPVTVAVTAGGGLRWLRWSGSGWTDGE